MESINVVKFLYDMFFKMIEFYKNVWLLLRSPINELPFVLADYTQNFLVFNILGFEIDLFGWIFDIVFSFFSIFPTSVRVYDIAFWAGLFLIVWGIVKRFLKGS